MNFLKYIDVVRTKDNEEIREVLTMFLDFYWAPNPIMLRLFDVDHEYKQTHFFVSLADALQYSGPDQLDATT